MIEALAPHCCRKSIRSTRLPDSGRAGWRCGGARTNWPNIKEPIQPRRQVHAQTSKRMFLATSPHFKIGIFSDNVSHLMAVLGPLPGTCTSPTPLDLSLRICSMHLRVWSPTNVDGLSVFLGPPESALYTAPYHLKYSLRLGLRRSAWVSGCLMNAMILPRSTLCIGHYVRVGALVVEMSLGVCGRKWREQHTASSSCDKRGKRKPQWGIVDVV
jgi:hypothetical protein